MGMALPLQTDSSFQRLAVRWFRSGGPDISVRTFEREEPIYREGDPANLVYCVESGSVRLARLGSAGRQCPMALCISGELLGEMAICGMAIRSESAIPVERVTVRLAPLQAFAAFVDREGLGEALIAYFANGILVQQRNIAMLLLEPCERRLALTLLELSDRHGYATRIPLRLTHAELGEMIGTTRSRVGHFLKRFRELGLLEHFDAGGVRVNRARLAEYCR